MWIFLTGNVQPYEFILPPTWKQVRVANILSGNYCQPKCAEPWVEVKFENSKQGTVQVVASPMVRLSNKPNATIEEIGNPDKIISALGQFVTGNSYDPDEVLETSVDKKGDQTVSAFKFSFFFLHVMIVVLKWLSPQLFPQTLASMFSSICMLAAQCTKKNAIWFSVYPYKNHQ